MVGKGKMVGIIDYKIQKVDKIVIKFKYLRINTNTHKY